VVEEGVVMIKNFISGLKLGFHTTSESIATLVNTILLLIVYFVGVGITSIIARVSGKKFLDLKTSKENSYWSDLNLKTEKIDEYYKQF
jgi:Na+-driven multidrug efflux pump